MRKNTTNRLAAITTAISAYWPGIALSAGASKPGLPQLDTSTWPSQLFWLVILFCAGYLMMAKVVTPRIGAVLEERRKTLDSDLEKARVASADAAKTRDDYENKLEMARNEAAEVAKQAAAESSQKNDDAVLKAEQKLSERIVKAEAKLTEAKKNAMDNLNEIAAEAAVDAAAALVGMKVTNSNAIEVSRSISSKTAKQETN